MRNEAKKRTILIILIVITCITVNFVITNRELLFDDRSINGETILVLRITSDVNIDEIKEIVQQVSQQNVQSIEIQAVASNRKEAIVKMSFMDPNRIQDMDNRLKMDFIKDVEVLEITSIGGQITLETRNKIYVALVIAVGTILTLLFLYIPMTKKKLTE